MNGKQSIVSLYEQTPRKLSMFKPNPPLGLILKTIFKKVIINHAKH